MTWHVIVHVGQDDSYEPDIDPATPRLVLSFEADPSENIFPMRENILSAVEAVALRAFDPEAYDLATLAMTVYAADHCIERSTAPDSWTRQITLHLPVAKTAQWKRAKDTLTEMLSFLTGDEWQIVFRKRRWEPEVDIEEGSFATPDSVALFSGGADSLVGAIDLLEQEHTTVLVGHYGPGMTRQFQNAALELLKAQYNDRALSSLFFVDPPTIPGARRETTKRSRSILFLALGLLVANAIQKDTPLYVFENGLISLNVPFTDSRSGSLSTRTTHPYVISGLRRVLSEIGLQNPIHLPFRFKTKGEMLLESRNVALLNQILPHTMSCAHPEAARWSELSPGTHCGYCVPCIVRRAACLAAEAPDAPYAVDVLTAPPDHKKKSGKDHWAIRIALDRFHATDRAHDICDALSAGPLPPKEIAEWVAVYRRGMNELASYFQSK